MILTVLDIIIIVGSLVVTILLGLFWGPKDKNPENDDDTEKSAVEDYILAKNQIGWLATGASLAASWSSAFGLIGLPVQLMVSGVVIYGASMVAFVVAILLITTYVIPVILDNNLPSVFSLLKYKYGEDNCKLAMLFSLPFKFMLGGCQMYIPALVMHTLTGFDLTFIIIATNILVLFYTMIGGYRTVVITDTVQLVFMVAGTTVVAALILSGKYLDANFSEIWEFAGTMKRTDFLGKLTLSPYPQEAGPWVYLSMFLTFYNKIGCSQDMVQRLIAVKGGKQGAVKSLWLMFGITKYICILTYLIIGLATFYMVKGCAWFTPLTHGDEMSLDGIVPFMTVEMFIAAGDDLFGFPFVGFYAASLYSASLSSISSLLNAMAMLAITDILPILGVSFDVKNEEIVEHGEIVEKQELKMNLKTDHMCLVHDHSFSPLHTEELSDTTECWVCDGSESTLKQAKSTPSRNSKSASDASKMWWSRVAIILTSILITGTSLFVAWLSTIQINSYTVLVIFSSLAAPFNTIVLLATLPFFGGHGKKSVKIGIILGLMTSVYFLSMGMLDPIPNTLKAVVNEYLPMEIGCTFNNSLPLTEMYQTPARAGPPAGYKPPVVEWTFLRRIHWISRFAAPIVVSMVTVVSTKVAHLVIGKENDKIGEVPKLKSVL